MELSYNGEKVSTNILWFTQQKPIARYFVNLFIVGQRGSIDSQTLQTFITAFWYPPELDIKTPHIRVTGYGIKQEWLTRKLLLQQCARTGRLYTFYWRKEMIITVSLLRVLKAAVMTSPVIEVHCEIVAWLSWK